MPASIAIANNPVLAAAGSYGRNLQPSVGPSAALAEAGTFSNYSHTIRGLGGFWQCKFTWHDEMAVLMEMMADGWLRDIRVMGERGTETWEGFYAESELQLTGGMPALSVTAYGYFRTLFGRVYNQTASGHVNANISAEVATIITAVGQFIGAQKIQANTSQVDRYHDADRWAGDILFDMCEAGDAANRRFQIGCYEDRGVRYEQIATYGAGAIDYQPAYRVDGLRGGVRLKGSISDFGNEVWVRHTPVGGALTRTPAAHAIDAISQAKWGRWDRPLSGGAASVAIADQIADTYLGFQGSPNMPDMTISADTVIVDQSGNPVPPEEVRPNNWLRVENLALPTSDVYGGLAQDPMLLFIEEVSFDEASGLGITSSRSRFVASIISRLAGRGGG